MFDNLCKRNSDINEHLPTLRDVASDCTHVVEMGVRAVVSTWAFLEGLKAGSSLIAIDYKHPSFYGGDITTIEKAAKHKGVKFGFFEADTLLVDIEPTDFLFLDTDHTYNQVKGELERHAKNVRKYIGFHDTTSCESEIMPAITEFLSKNKDWKLKARYTNNNGLLIIERC